MIDKKEEEAYAEKMEKAAGKKPYMPLSEIIGQKADEIFGIKTASLEDGEKNRLERGLMTDKVYPLTLPDGRETPGKIQLSKNFSAEGGVLAMYKPQYQKPYIPQETFDGYRFSMEEQEKLRGGENVLYKVKMKNGSERTRLAKLDLPKGEKDVNYTNQLTITDITRLPIDKMTYGQTLNQEQLVAFLNGKGTVIEDPKLGSVQHRGRMTLYFDPIKGGARYHADSVLRESFRIAQFARENRKIETDVTNRQRKPTP